MKPDDRQLLKGCLNGDDDAREMLVRRFSNLIYSTILGTVRSKGGALSEHDIQDLHSTVFVQLFDQNCRKLRQYKGTNGCSLASWIRMITVRAVLDHFRRVTDALARREKTVPLDMLRDTASGAASALENLENHERERIVASAMEKLPPRDQLMIRMHCMEGRSLKTMAKLLNVSENNVHSVKHRAVQRLKEKIGEMYPQKE